MIVIENYEFGGYELYDADSYEDVLNDGLDPVAFSNRLEVADVVAEWAAAGWSVDGLRMVFEDADYAVYAT